MGLFDIFKKPTIIEDEFFGRLRVMKVKSQQKSYYKGNAMFEPSGKMIPLIIEGDENGPSQQQREFYRWIQDNYRELVFKLTPLVEDEFGNWKPGFRIKNFDQEFHLVGLTIPHQNTAPLNWDLSFETIHDANHQVTINFIGDDPESVLIDG